MRLLNATKLDFRVFGDEELPLFAILSHTWGDEEVSYQELKFLSRLTAFPPLLKSKVNHDMQMALVAALEAAAGLDFSGTGRETISSRAGYKKITQTARLAKQMGLDWVWIDTCCIDKSSSAELQEAINSMYRWYQLAHHCIVYLDDALTENDPPSREPNFERMLRDSKWITRGWTLQELIAPSTVVFYDSAWSPIGEKHDNLASIRRVTGIPESVLATGDLSYASVAQKMAWAANRRTSRVEDRAYSLLGIFGVHLPMLYGERENAFHRLQEEILRTTTDDSIFAWTATSGGLNTYRGLLARSPEEFQNCRWASRGQGIFANSNMGLRMEMALQPLLDDERDEGLFLGLLNATWGTDKRIAVVLRQLEDQKFARVSANELEEWNAPADDPMDDESSPMASHVQLNYGDTTTLYVEHSPQLPPHFQSRLMHSIWFRRGVSEHSVPVYDVETIRPRELAGYHPPGILIGSGAYSGRHDFRVSVHKDIFIACVRLNNATKTNQTPSYRPMQLLLGYNTRTGEYWCRILGDRRWPPISASDEQWRAALQNSPALYGGTPQACFSTGVPHVRNINIKMYPAIQQDRSCLIVDIEGLHLGSHRGAQS